MKTILITGGNSFLAREFVNYFKNYQLIITDKNSLDVTNKKNVDAFFKHNQVDYVFHTAIKGGSRLKEDCFQDFVDNINMYNNLSANNSKFEIMFNFASGAEFDRERDIKLFKEEQILESMPKDFYGCSKNLISRDILNKNNIINIRLFGCFGQLENDSRFIKNTIKKCNNNEDIIISNKEMDFFSVQDLNMLIDNLLNKQISFKDINAVYKEKKDLVYIAKYIKALTNSNSALIIDEQVKNYSGSSEKIDSLGLNFCGLEKSIENLIKQS
jgi:GDP-L-fucose synthase